MTYYAWLKTKKNATRPVGIGALAAEAVADRSFPRKVDTLGKLLRYLRSWKSDNALDAARRSWSAWRREERERKQERLMRTAFISALLNTVYAPDQADVQHTPLYLKETGRI
jgi:uncharacterized protein YozE (UPF0346 family)